MSDAGLDKVVFRHLPYLMRKGGRSTAVYQLCRAIGRSYEQFTDDAKAVLASHYLPSADDLTDLDKLGAWFALSHWSEEDVGSFRRRLRVMAPIYLQGASNAERLLRVLAVAGSGTLLPRPDSGTVIMPPRHRDGLAGWLPERLLSSDRFQTIAVVTRDEVAMPGMVEDLPLQEREQTIDAAPWTWQIDNPLQPDPPDEHPLSSQPAGRIEPQLLITAGATDLPMPVLVQRDLPRAVLINAIIPAGTTARIDLADGSICDETSGDPLPPGKLLHKGQPAPGLLYAKPTIVDAASWPGDGDGSEHHLRWYAAGDLELVEAVAPLRGPLTAQLPWPPLLPTGLSNWGLLALAWRDDIAPVDVHRLYLRPLRPAMAPSSVTMRWQGRQPGTFTVRFPAAMLAVGAGGGAHRRRWFDEQVERLKLAGTIYLHQEDCANWSDDLAALWPPVLAPEPEPEPEPEPIVDGPAEPEPEPEPEPVPAPQPEPEPPQASAHGETGLGDSLHLLVVVDQPGKQRARLGLGDHLRLRRSGPDRPGHFAAPAALTDHLSLRATTGPQP